jgi:hypothetical protein
MRIIFAVLCFSSWLYAADLLPVIIAKDSIGIVVHLKEKYGAQTVDTCTIVSIYNGCFVLTKREGFPNYYPVENHSIVLEALK